MNVKTYSFVKYIATLGALFLFLAPLLGFLQEWSLLAPGHFHGHALFKTDSALAPTLWVLEIVGIILIVAYVYIRERLRMKSGYTYTKKDLRKLALSYVMYGAEMIISLVYVIITCGIFKSANQSHSRIVGLMIAFAPMYVAQFAAAILAAIFESMSRIQEQVYLYRQQDDLKKTQGAKVSKTGTKRTAEAQALVADDEDEDVFDKKAAKKKPKAEPKKEIEHKSEEYIDDEKTLEDFFNEDDSDDEKDNK